jgi:hypothetical protein
MRGICYKAAMLAIPFWSRLVRSVLFFASSDLILLWFTAGDVFCGHGRIAVATELALAFAVLDLCASSGTAVAVNLSGVNPKAAPLLSALITGVGIASVPFWIYRGYGIFRLQGTWADVSCGFTEDFGISFLFAVAPALAFLSLVLGWLTLRFTRIPAQLFEC